MKKKVLHRINSMYEELSDKEKLIADYILKEPEKIVYKTINEVADELLIAKATVFRLAKRLGFNGFQQMKIELATELSDTKKDILETIQDVDSSLEISKKVFQSNINALEYTRNLLKKQDIEDAIQFLLNSQKIFFYGNGGSGTVALDAQHKFLRTGLFTQAFTDTHLQLMSASQLDSTCCAVFITHSGKNRDLIDVMEVAKRNKAKTICITNFSSNQQLFKYIDVCLYTSSTETEYRPEALSSRMAQLTIIDVLYVNYCILNKEKSTNALSKIRRAVSKKK